MKKICGENWVTPINSARRFVYLQMHCGMKAKRVIDRKRIIKFSNDRRQI